MWSKLAFVSQFRPIRMSTFMRNVHLSIQFPSSLEGIHCTHSCNSALCMFRTEPTSSEHVAGCHWGWKQVASGTPWLTSTSWVTWTVAHIRCYFSGFRRCG